MVAGPAQPDHHAPVVPYERDPLEVERVAEALERSDVALPGARWVRLGVSEARQVERDRTYAGACQRAQRLAPHVGGLGISVDEQCGRRADRRLGRQRLAVGDRADALDRLVSHALAVCARAGGFHSIGR